MTSPSGPIWGKRLTLPPDQLMVEFCAGRDVAPVPMADEALLPFDLWTNRAHVIMLHRQGIVSRPVAVALLEALGALEEDWAAGRFALDPALEDVHINVERWVTARAGADAGGRLHTARSRNDQVACDMRMFMRTRLLELGQAVAGLVAALLHQAREHSDTVMPGFSHHQPAMPTTWGHWLCAHAQALCRDLERAGNAYALINRGPLGAVASFGTSWPIDRELAAGLLAFPTVEYNTLDCISSRWEGEAEVAHVVGAMMNHLATLAQDLILLSHPYWAMVSLADAYVTGSSIMPQKRNPDFAEVIKGKAAWVHGMAAGLMAVPHGAMSGYHRDSQGTKYAVMDILRECLPAPVVMRGAVETLTVHPEAMRARLKQGYLLAADFADGLARALDLPFRDCYGITAEAVRLSEPAGEITEAAARRAVEAAGHDPAKAAEVLAALGDPAQVVARRVHTGAPAKLPVRIQADRFLWLLSGHTDFFTKEQARLDAAYQRCKLYGEQELG